MPSRNALYAVLCASMLTANAEAHIPQRRSYLREYLRQRQSESVLYEIIRKAEEAKKDIEQILDSPGVRMYLPQPRPRLEFKLAKPLENQPNNYVFKYTSGDAIQVFYQNNRRGTRFERHGQRLDMIIKNPDGDYYIKISGERGKGLDLESHLNMGVWIFRKK